MRLFRCFKKTLLSNEARIRKNSFYIVPESLGVASAGLSGCDPKKSLLEENSSASTLINTVFSPGNACNVCITGSWIERKYVLRQRPERSVRGFQAAAVAYSSNKFDLTRITVRHLPTWPICGLGSKTSLFDFFWLQAVLQLLTQKGFPSVYIIVTRGKENESSL